MGGIKSSECFDSLVCVRVKGGESERGWQASLGPKLMVGMCRLSMLESCIKQCLYLLLRMAETMSWKEERSSIRAAQMDNFRGLLCIRRIDKVLNAWVRELCRVTKGVDKRIEEGVLWWFCHVEWMERDRIVKRVYVGECVGS